MRERLGRRVDRIRYCLLISWLRNNTNKRATSRASHGKNWMARERERGREREREDLSICLQVVSAKADRPRGPGLILTAGALLKSLTLDDMVQVCV